MMKAETSAVGFDRAIARLARLQHSLPRAAGRSLEGPGLAIFAASEAEVPRRSGALAASGYISPVTEEGDGSFSVRIGYRGLKYTRIVHYNTQLRHLSGKAYFLIDPKRRFDQLVIDSAAAAVKAELAG